MFFKDVWAHVDKPALIKNLTPHFIVHSHKNQSITRMSFINATPNAIKWIQNLDISLWLLCKLYYVICTLTSRLYSPTLKYVLILCFYSFLSWLNVKPYKWINTFFRICCTFYSTLEYTNSLIIQFYLHPDASLICFLIYTICSENRQWSCVFIPS